MPRYADLHLHTTASDGTLTPPELTELSYRSGLSVIALTDHDTVGGVKEALRTAPSGLTVIPGIELSSICTFGSEAFRLHILGYGIDPDAPSLLDVVRAGQEMRRRKHSLRLEYLERKYGIVLTESEKESLRCENSVAKPHIARIIMNRGLAESVTDAIVKYMSAPDFPNGFIPHTMAIEGILASGGIPVYAHPLGGECEKRISLAEVERRVEILRSSGLLGLECYYSRYTKEESRGLSDIAERYGLLISGGSDFHGANKTVRLGELSREGDRISEKNLTLLTKLGLF